MPKTSLSNGNDLMFPEPFKHDHPPIVDVGKVYEEQLTFGQRMADKVANIVGSWKFIIIQSVVLAAWVVLNVSAWVNKWDPYPFILMNLVLSLQAAYAAPIIMMSQNRLSARDRVVAQHDFVVNTKAETEIRAILDHLAAQDAALKRIHRLLSERLGKLEHRVVEKIETIPKQGEQT